MLKQNDIGLYCVKKQAIAMKNITIFMYKEKIWLSARFFDVNLRLCMNF